MSQLDPTIGPPLDLSLDAPPRTRGRRFHLPGWLLLILSNTTSRIGLGTGVLSVAGKEVARNSMEHTIPVTFPEAATFDVGQDTRTGVALVEYRYDTPFKFTGKINKLTFKLEPEPKSQTTGKN